jgi:hypothetical protein
MWICISADERPTRCEPSREPWITNRWPLRELGMARRDCERWLLERYGLHVPKSACVGCLTWNTSGAGRANPRLRRPLERTGNRL